MFMGKADQSVTSTAANEDHCFQTRPEYASTDGDQTGRKDG